MISRAKLKKVLPTVVPAVISLVVIASFIILPTQADEPHQPQLKEAPTLSSPANGSTVSNLTPRLAWNPPTGATSYGLQVATESTFTNLVVNQTGIANPYYDLPPGELNSNTGYYWRVNASNAAGTSAWSSY